MPKIHIKWHFAWLIIRIAGKTRISQNKFNEILKGNELGSKGITNDVLKVFYLIYQKNTVSFVEKAEILIG